MKNTGLFSDIHDTPTGVFKEFKLSNSGNSGNINFTGYDETKIKKIAELTKKLNEGEAQIKRDAEIVRLDNTIYKGDTTVESRLYRAKQLEELISKVEKIRTELQILTGGYYPKQY